MAFVLRLKSTADVYDLEVDTYHNFIVDKGMVISNCRYATEEIASDAGML